MQTTQIDFKQYNQRASKAIEKELLCFSQEWQMHLKNNVQDLLQVNRTLTDSFYGGKMLRGTLVKLGYDLLQTSETPTIFKPAAAFEILHTSLLIHDDIIDQSPMRRGKPALHMISNDNHYGISQAICLGDLGITFSIKLLSESDYPEGIKSRVLQYFLHMLSDTILGEMLDIRSSRLRQRTEKQIILMQKMKTANYTFVGPLTVGALLAGAAETLLKTIKQYGENLGIAFQIQDDILGIFGDEYTIGKSTTSDIEENKSTLLLVYSLAHASTAQKIILKKIYGKKKLTAEQQAMIKKVFNETGALLYCKKKIRELVSQAKAVIPLMTQNEKTRYLLSNLADSLITPTQ